LLTRHHDDEELLRVRAALFAGANVMTVRWAP
jgi:hypothetical protein